MTLQHIANARMHSQLLAGNTASSVVDVVSYMGAIQAQDYPMSRWAVGIRSGATDKMVHDAVESGAVIRTHVLRPTWHLVAAEDVRWMLALTAPNIRKQYRSMLRIQGVDEKDLVSYKKKITRALRDSNYLTREELMQLLELKGSFANDLRPALLMMDTELDAIVCNGPMRGRQQTYALLDERVPAVAPISHDEALARLAQRYFISHGPATVQDFGWWSGLTASQSRQALALVSGDMSSVTIADQVYWYYDGVSFGANEHIHFLPAFDEFLISYKDRTASIGLQHQPLAFTKNGIFKPVIVAGGKVIGVWKRTTKVKTTSVEMSYFSEQGKAAQEQHAHAIALYGKHLETDLVLS